MIMTSSEKHTRSRWHLVGPDDALNRFFDGVHEWQNTGDRTAPVSMSEGDGRYIHVEPEMLRLVRCLATAAGLKLESADHPTDMIIAACKRSISILQRLQSPGKEIDRDQLLRELGWSMDGIYDWASKLRQQQKQNPGNPGSRERS